MSGNLPTNVGALQRICAGLLREKKALQDELAAIGIGRQGDSQQLLREKEAVIAGLQQQLEQLSQLQKQSVEKLRQQEESINSLRSFTERPSDAFTTQLVQLLQLEPKNSMQEMQMDIVAALTNVLQEYVATQAKFKAERARAESLFKEHEELVMMLNKRPENAQDLIEFVEANLSQQEQKNRRLALENTALKKELAEVSSALQQAKIELSNLQQKEQQSELRDYLIQSLQDRVKQLEREVPVKQEVPKPEMPRPVAQQRPPAAQPVQKAVPQGTRVTKKQQPEKQKQQESPEELDRRVQEIIAQQGVQPTAKRSKSIGKALAEELNDLDAAMARLGGGEGPRQRQQQESPRADERKPEAKKESELDDILTGLVELGQEQDTRPQKKASAQVESLRARFESLKRQAAAM